MMNNKKYEPRTQFVPFPKYGVDFAEAIESVYANFLKEGYEDIDRIAHPEGVVIIGVREVDDYRTKRMRLGNV